MLTWLRRLFDGGRPSRRELSATENHLDGLDARVDYLAAELKALRGRVTGAERKQKPPQDTPGETNDESEVSEQGGSYARPKLSARAVPRRSIRGW